MKVSSIVRKPMLLITVSALLLSGLLLFTYTFSNKHPKGENAQSQIKTVSPETNEQAFKNSIPRPEEPAESVEPVSNNEKSTSPSRSASNSSQTTINISSDNNSENVSTNVSLRISDDGCTVEANGTQGTQLVIDATNGKKGGQQSYTLDGNPLTVPSGGMLAGMTIEARLTDPSGNIKASSSSTIGENGCS